jgi:hypothetical protein
MKHITIFREPGRFAGWPANYGIWSWGDEIVVGFTAGYHNLSGGFHAVDHNRPFEALQARSLDGGLTWDVSPFPRRAPGGRGFSADEHMVADLHAARALGGGDAPQPCPGGIHFTHPDFALMCARTGLRAGARSWFYISYDRCRSWEGPYDLPMFGQTGIAARTDYLVSSRDECTLFLTAAKPNGEEGWAFCARTQDGGKTFSFLSWITPEPEGFTIMPASLRLSPSGVLAAVRCCSKLQEFTSRQNWIDLYRSEDDGATWHSISRPVPMTGSGGNPPTLTRLPDGRLCLVYGYRAEPFGMRARFSADEGSSWSDDLVLRADGGCHDLGYPRTVLRPDGTLVSVYYYNDHPEGERYIAATLWKPEELGI